MTRSKKNASKYVYGVVRARRGSRQRLRGINDEPVRIVAHDGIGALASDVPDGALEAGRDELLAHSRVLEGALEKGVVLPMRFGMVMPGEEAIREELLGAHADELRTQLDEMEGKIEVNVKAIYEEQAILREVLAENAEVAKLRQAIEGKPEEATYFERIRLGELVAEALAAKREQDERGLVDRLQPHALAVQVGPAAHERMAANVSYLVARDRLTEFDRAVDQLGAEQAGRIRFKYTGPLPPHSFVELAVEA
jgi:Gas vesicle synthesis protein GvpL/GvpF